LYAFKPHVSAPKPKIVATLLDTIVSTSHYEWPPFLSHWKKTVNC